MKRTSYKIIFEDDTVIIERGFCFEEARIVAQAERIKEGKPYKIKSYTTLN